MFNVRPILFTSMYSNSIENLLKDFEPPIGYLTECYDAIILVYTLSIAGFSKCLIDNCR